MSALATDKVELWEIREITVNTQAGAKTEQALVHPRVSGLAITNHNFTTFDVTHLATGHRIASRFGRWGAAALCATQLAFCADWTLPTGKEISAFIDANADDPIDLPIEDYYQIEKGVTRGYTRKELVTLCRSVNLPGDDFPWESASDSPEGRCAKLLGLLPAPPSSTEEPPK